MLAHVQQRCHRVPIEAAQWTMSKSKSWRYQVPDRAGMWAALDPTPPSPTTRTDVLVICSMPLLAGDNDDDNNDDDDNDNDNNNDNDDKDKDKYDEDEYKDENKDEDKDGNDNNDDNNGGGEK
jgi:hypothetical protein